MAVAESFQEFQTRQETAAFFLAFFVFVTVQFELKAKV
jgi:hypothetical protein